MAFPNRCVNCTITFDNPRIASRGRGVLELDLPLRGLLMSWIPHIQVLSEHRVCEECIVVLQSQVWVDESARTRNYGHKSVCLGCGVSVLRARSIGVDKNRPEYTIIQSWVPQIQADLPIFTRVCRRCWRRATRAEPLNVAQTKQEVEQELPNVKLDMEIPVEMPLHASVGAQAVEDISRLPTHPPLPIHVPNQNIDRPFRPNIALPNYQRVSSTSRRCIFNDCQNVEQKFLLIPIIIRQRVLIDFKIYIPRYATICSDHLYVNTNWDNLQNEHLVNTFTSEQIEDMLFLKEYSIK